MKLRELVSLTTVAVTLSAAVSAPEYTTIDPDGEPLRSAFNAGAGKVRVLMLVAPT